MIGRIRKLVSKLVEEANSPVMPVAQISTSVFTGMGEKVFEDVPAEKEVRIEEDAAEEDAAEESPGLSPCFGDHDDSVLAMRTMLGPGVWLFGESTCILVGKQGADLTGAVVCRKVGDVSSVSIPGLERIDSSIEELGTVVVVVMGSGSVYTGTFAGVKENGDIICENKDGDLYCYSPSIVFVTSETGVLKWIQDSSLSVGAASCRPKIRSSGV